MTVTQSPARWAGPISTITLFVDDVAAVREFYGRVFGLPVVFEDDVSTVVRFGETQVNLLESTQAPELVSPEPVAIGGGARMLLTITVPDVDAACEDLRSRGVELLNGPIDRPWGVRTAAFRDPAGNVWELAT